MKFDEYKREGSETAVKAAGGYRLEPENKALANSMYSYQALTTKIKYKLDTLHTICSTVGT